MLEAGRRVKSFYCGLLAGSCRRNPGVLLFAVNSIPETVKMETVRAVPESEPDPKKGKKRTVSGVKFPYYDLSDAITVAKAIHEKAGGACDLDQLASWLDHKSINSGAFRLRVSAAKMFGLVEKAGTGKLRVSKRGVAIVAPVTDSQVAEAKKAAFLAVELFQKVYERFRGMTLPQVAGLRNVAKEEYEVAPKRAEDAVRVMLESAEQAGFFAASGDRTKMVAPVIGTSAATERPAIQHPPFAPEVVNDPPGRNGGRGGGGDGGDYTGIDPYILEFVRKLPASGTTLSEKRRKVWIDGFSGALDVVYPDKEDEE